MSVKGNKNRSLLHLGLHRQDHGVRGHDIYCQLRQNAGDKKKKTTITNDNDNDDTTPFCHLIFHAVQATLELSAPLHVLVHLPVDLLHFAGRPETKNTPENTSKVDMAVRTLVVTRPNNRAWSSVCLFRASFV